MTSKASQQAATQDFIDDMLAFTAASIEWCAKESETAAGTVGTTIHFLLNDAKRISSMSAEALQVLQDLRSRLTHEGTASKATDLIATLKQLSAEEADVLKLADPVIEALQFQDRVTQQMENMVRMIAVWANARTSMTSTPELTEAQKIAFGNALLACTTMTDERDFIRMAIPELPEETKVEAATLF